jgi:hypothetical protein
VTSWAEVLRDGTIQYVRVGLRGGRLDGEPRLSPSHPAGRHRAPPARGQGVASLPVDTPAPAPLQGLPDERAHPQE